MKTLLQKRGKYISAGGKRAKVLAISPTYNMALISIGQTERKWKKARQLT